MNTKIASLLTTAVLTGMLASNAVNAEEGKPADAKANAAGEKKSCNGEKGSCCSAEKHEKMKKEGKSGCCGKGGCGGMMDEKKTEAPAADAKAPEAKAPAKGK